MGVALSHQGAGGRTGLARAGCLAAGLPGPSSQGLPPSATSVSCWGACWTRSRVEAESWGSGFVWVSTRL